jgi:hypothetical protein
MPMRKFNTSFFRKEIIINGQIYAALAQGNFVNYENENYVAFAEYDEIADEYGSIALVLREDITEGKYGYYAAYLPVDEETSRDIAAQVAEFLEV